jgi:hypothetical protein
MGTTLVALAMRRIIVTALGLLPLLLGKSRASPQRAESDHAVVRWGADLRISPSKRYPGGTKQLPKVGVIVNLNEGMVSFLGYVAHINSPDAAYVQFGESYRRPVRRCQN